MNQPNNAFHEESIKLVEHASEGHDRGHVWATIAVLAVVLGGLGMFTTLNNRSEAETPSEMWRRTTAVDDNMARAVTDVQPVHALVAPDGNVVLWGRVSNLEIADRIEDKFTEIVGAERVESEFMVSPGVVLPEAIPLYLENHVLFQLASAEVGPDFAVLLDVLGDLLNEYPQTSLEVIGHTDSQGDADANMVLSQDRANQVLAALASNGVASEQISGEGRGENDPVASNDSESGRQSNRRAEILLSGLGD